MGINRNHKTIREKEGKTKPTRYYSNSQEKSVAKSIGGKRTLNSGATPYQKGDITSDNFLIECKTKTRPSESVSIKKEWLTKLNAESVVMGKKYTALAFDFGDGETYYIVDKFLFQELLEKLESDYER